MNDNGTPGASPALSDELGLGDVRLSAQIGIVDKMRRWLDGETTHNSVTLIQAAVLEIERLNSVAKNNFEAAAEALDGCAIDVAAERERIASACWERRGHFASDGAARAFADLVRAGKA